MGQKSGQAYHKPTYHSASYKKISWIINAIIHVSSRLVSEHSRIWYTYTQNQPFITIHILGDRLLIYCHTN